MKKFLLAGVALSALLGGSAMAADVAVRAPYQAPPPPVWSWTGFYIGGHVGAGWGTKEWTNFFSERDGAHPGFLDIRENSHPVSGFLGGGQVGFNYQTGWVVWGVEGQFSGADLDGHGFCGSALVGALNCNTKVRSIATVAGRVGVTVDRALIYAKGGGAWARDEFSLSTSFFPPAAASISDTRSGWMFGTGIEYALAGNWSVKVEYNYLDFGTKSYVFASGVTTGCGGVKCDVLGDSWDIRQRINLIKAGVNYRFGSWGAGY